jgi:hypothetical protein
MTWSMLSTMDDDDPPDVLAAVDQGIAGLGTRAKIIRAYYKHLLDQEFDQDQAFQLTRDYAAKWTV